MDVSTRAMRLFVAVLDSENFSEVARREGMAPSSVSRLIHQLESKLESQLLHRNTRAIIPTEAGRLYGQRFRQILGDLNETAQILMERKQEPGGLVRINAFVVFAQKHIAPWLPELNARYPKLQFELMQTDEFIDPLTDAADLLFRYGPLQDSGFRARVIDRPVYRFAASPGYLAHHGYPETPSDLHHHKCLVYKGVLGAQRAYFTRPGHDPEVHTFSSWLESNNAESLVRVALGDGGIVMMPDWQIGEHLKQKRLVHVLPEYHASTRQDEQVIAMLYPYTRFLPLSVRTVIDFFIEKFGTPPYWNRTDRPFPHLPA